MYQDWIFVLSHNPTFTCTFIGGEGAKDFVVNCKPKTAPEASVHPPESLHTRRAAQQIETPCSDGPLRVPLSFDSIIFWRLASENFVMLILAVIITLTFGSTGHDHKQANKG